MKPSRALYVTVGACLALTAHIDFFGPFVVASVLGGAAAILLDMNDY